MRRASAVPADPAQHHAQQQQSAPSTASPGSRPAGRRHGPARAAASAVREQSRPPSMNNQQPRPMHSERTGARDAPACGGCASARPRTAASRWPVAQQLARAPRPRRRQGEWAWDVGWGGQTGALRRRPRRRRPAATDRRPRARNAGGAKRSRGTLSPPARRARMASMRARLTPKSLRPTREAERTCITPAAGSNQNSASSTKLHQPGRELHVQVVVARSTTRAPGMRLDDRARRAIVAGPSPCTARARCARSPAADARGHSSAWLLTLLGVFDGGFSRPSRTPRSAGGRPLQHAELAGQQRQQRQRHGCRATSQSAWPPVATCAMRGLQRPASAPPPPPRSRRARRG